MSEGLFEVLPKFDCVNHIPGSHFPGILEPRGPWILMFPLGHERKSLEHHSGPLTEFKDLNSQHFILLDSDLKEL